ncbi:MAG: MFS transporter [Bacteroidales bacterium]|jgi:PAT family beta-lactamase induction signal transducer AmpG|nr:MFS transporter [Bacteroidales bacterium]
MSAQTTNRSPWTWIPTLYLAEGLPYVAVNIISVIMYKRMGISNADIALYTSLLYLPWVIKPIWSPLVDLLKTKRWWIVITQLVLAIGFASIALTIPAAFFFKITLAFFWLLAFASATHDIAADGFYMLGLNTNQQAKYVGIRSTFYRVATITGQGLLVILAGFLESSSGREPVSIFIEASPQYSKTVLQVPHVTVPDASGDGMYFITGSDSLLISTQTVDKDSLAVLLDSIKASNISNGFYTVEEKQAKQKGWWAITVSEPLGAWIRENFGEERGDIASVTGSVAVVPVSLSRKPEQGREVVLNTALKKGDRSIALIQGEHLVFSEANWDRPAYMVFQADSKLTGYTSASYEGLSGNIPMAWAVTFFVLAGLFLVFSFYHKFVLPRPDTDRPHENLKPVDVLREFGATFASFFRKPQVGVALFFMLTFRFAEAQLLKLINPFLLDPIDKGGLGLTTGEVGLVYGTVGIIGLTLGGIIGGVVAAWGGLKKWLWPMTLSMLLTSATFLYLSFTQTDNLLIINICVFVEQFGYGFGFTAYMLYLIYFSEGKYKTAHYAICTGFMAMGMMLPGMFAGWLQEQLGYNHFFLWVMICSIVPLIAVSLLKVDPGFGKKNSTQN